MRNAAPEPAALTAIPPPDPALVARFRVALDALHAPAPDDRIGLAISGGPDSLALLLLANAAYSGRVEAATVDHGLRAESAAEAAMVAAICHGLGIPHRICKRHWRDATGAGLQAAARCYRYEELGRWCHERRLRLLATAHHADDQAETLLLRLARGAGVGGLAGVRPFLPLDEWHDRTPALDDGAAGHGTCLVRPLLGFVKRELEEIVAAAGIHAVHDPSNDSERFDRTHARRLLRDCDWLDPLRLAAGARHLADADDALRWATRQEIDRRVTKATTGRGDGAWLLDPEGLPEEILRRMVSFVLHAVEDRTVAGSHGTNPAGPELTRFIARLKKGQTATMWHVLARPGPRWRFSPAPPRRSRADSP